MAIKITTDSTKCDGFGNCVIAAGDIFDLDDNGLVTLKLDTVGDERLEAVRRAVYDCPVNAITFTFTQE